MSQPKRELIVLAAWFLSLIVPPVGNADDRSLQPCPTQDPSEVTSRIGKTARPDVRTLSLGAYEARVDGHFLVLIDGSGEEVDDYHLKQHDFGGLDAVQPDATGGLIALGEYRSYQIPLIESDGALRLGERVPFPRLYVKRCSVVGRWTGLCRIARAYYIPSMKAAFIAGYSGFFSYESYVFGLDRDPKLSAPNGSPLTIYSSSAEPGVVLMRDRDSNFYQFDGESLEFCTRDRP